MTLDDLMFKPEIEKALFEQFSKVAPLAAYNTIPYEYDDNGEITNLDVATEATEFGQHLLNLRPDLNEHILIANLANGSGKSVALAYTLALLLTDSHPTVDHKGIDGDIWLITNTDLLKTEYTKFLFESPGILGNKEESKTKNGTTILLPNNTTARIKAYWSGDGLLEKVENVTNNKKILFYSFNQGDQSYAGKAQSLNSSILTEMGWVTFKDIKVGDLVKTPDGKDTTIIGIKDWENRPIYKVHFNDGSIVEADENHLWQVQTNWLRECSNSITQLTTIELKKRLEKNKKQRISVPLSNINFQHRPTIINPYLLGILLGDGCLRDSVGVPTITTEDLFISNYITQNFDTYIKSKKGTEAKDIRIKNQKLKDNLKELNLWNTISNNKFIPEEYKYNTKEVRLEILRGLMDTDGYISRIQDKYARKTVDYCSVSKQLAEDVAFIVKSLGGIAKIKTKIPTYTHKGEKKQGQLAYIVSFTLPNNPFKLPRKFDIFEGLEPKTTRNKYITKIEFDRIDATRCVTLEDTKGLYITDGITVTHNSPLVVCIDEMGERSKKRNSANTFTEDKMAEIINRVGRSYKFKGKWLIIMTFTIIFEEWVRKLIRTIKKGEFIIPEINPDRQCAKLVQGKMSNPYLNMETINVAKKFYQIIGREDQIRIRHEGRGDEDPFLVFPEFNRPQRISVTDVRLLMQRAKNEKGWEFFEGIDPGWSDVCAVNFFLAHPIEGLFMIDEIYANHKTVNEIASLIRAKEDMWGIPAGVKRIFDPNYIKMTRMESEGLSNLKRWRKEGISGSPCPVRGRSYDSYYTLIKKDLLKYSEICKNYEMELENHKKDEHGIPLEKDVNHSHDATRYVINYYYMHYFKKYHTDDRNEEDDLTPMWKKQYQLEKQHAIAALNKQTNSYSSDDNSFFDSDMSSDDFVDDTNYMGL